MARILPIKRRSRTRPRSRSGALARHRAFAGLTAALCTGASAAPADDRLSAVDLLQRAIRIQTTRPSPIPDAERSLAALYVEALRRAGLEATLVDTPAGPGGERTAAAFARLRGSGDGAATLLLSHLDVVPANPALWKHDPYAGRREGGFVIGRGALDAKGVSVVHLAALAELAARPKRLRRDVVFLATPGEETGGRDGAGYLTRERADLLRGVDGALTEGGGIHRSKDGASVWGVSVTEKTPCWIQVRARGEPGHSSAPTPDTAVHRLIAALDRVRRIETPVRVVPAVARMFRELAPLAPVEDRDSYARLSQALAEDSTFRRRFLGNPARAALVRNTIAITMLEGAPRTNVLPARARARLDTRLLPGDDCAGFRDELAAVIDDRAVELEIELAFAAAQSATDTKLFRAVEVVAAELDPDARVVPRLVAGFTDAHWLRERGIPTYGFVPRWLSSGESRRIHGPGERISEENLQRGIRTTVRILEVLDLF
ncbi:MAG: M20/M25/M40 family metallo-hydrolase [Myxococcota bacterium]